MTFIGGRGEAKSKPSSWIKLTREVVPSWLLQIISCTRNASPGNSENVTNKAFWFSFCNWIKRTFCKQFRHYDAMQLSNGLNKYKLSIRVESDQVEADWMLFVKLVEVKTYPVYLIQRYACITLVWCGSGFPCTKQLTWGSPFIQPLYGEVMWMWLDKTFV